MNVSGWSTFGRFILVVMAAQHFQKKVFGRRDTSGVDDGCAHRKTENRHDVRLARRVLHPQAGQAGRLRHDLCGVIEVIAVFWVKLGPKVWHKGSKPGLSS